MLEDDNRRRYQRIDIDCPASVRIGRDGQRQGAVVKNLSGNGLLLWLEQAVDEGAEFEITVCPKTPITPPLTARVRVVRSTAIPDSEGSYAVACSIEEVLPSRTDAD
jgi:hypothetical protein